MTSKNHNFPLRISVERAEAYKAAADALGITAAEYIVRQADKGLPKEVRATLPERKKQGRPKKDK